MNTIRSGSEPETRPSPLPASTNEAAGEERNEALFERRPVQAVKVSYGLPWLHCLLALSLAVVAWVAIKPPVERLLWPKAVSKAPRDADSFVAIAYEGVSSKESEVSPERFREHIRALRKAGYTPIGLKDVERLLYWNEPVPRKAVLLTMDQSRKTSYFATHGILRRAGWNAVMFLWTKPILESDSAAMLWPYIRNMARSGVWEIGAQSHNGFSRVRTSRGGLAGNFMTSPIWKDDLQRYESLDEFLKRLKDDHDQCLSCLETQLGFKPDAYAFPYGDFGQFQQRSVMTRPANLGLAGERYRLAFILGNLALNTRYTHPLRLNRLFVKAEWSGRELVEWLDRSWPHVPRAPGKNGRLPAKDWIVDWGGMSQEADGSLALAAGTNTTGAKMWLAGSEQMFDYTARLRFRLEEGQMGLFLRASGDGESFVYLGLDAGGEVWLGQMANGRDRLALPEMTGDGYVWLRQKQLGSGRFTLASSHVTIQPNREHELEIFLRDRFFSARLNGQELFRNRNLLRGETIPGLIGLSVWSARKGVARARLTGLEVRELTPTVAAWSPDQGHDAQVCRWIFDNAFRLTDLSPKWLDAASPGSWSASKADLRFYRLLGRVHRLRLFPQVTISDERGLRRITPSLLADRVGEERVNGVLVNLESMGHVALPVLAAWLQPCAVKLAAKGMKLLVRLPPACETRGQVNSLLALIPGVQVAVGESSPVPVGKTSVSGAVVRVESVPTTEGEDDLPLFYMIPTSGEGLLVETEEAKSSRLQQEGMAAYQDGQYERAAELWQEWRRLEPDNPKASMLVGDALSRMGDLTGAVQEYDRSLELDPGQLSLAVRRAEFYAVMGQPARTLESLNLYARLFPGQAEILLAQARWLCENGRTEEAASVATRLTVLQPGNVDAIALLLRLTTDPEKRREAMTQLIAAGGEPRNHMALGQAVWKYALTAQPDADELDALVEKIAAGAKDPQLAELYNRIRFRADPSSEGLADGQLSTNRWWLEGASLAKGPNGGAIFAAGKTYSEGNLRLLGSLRLRNVFIESQVNKTQGNFWLYTCRTPNHMIRFGFTGNDELLRLQAWRGNRLAAERKIVYVRPANPVRLRLETQGDGAMGYVDGRPMFDGCLPLTPDVGFGWVGLAVHAPERGRASAEITDLLAGPAPLRLGMLAPATTEEAADAQLAAIRPDVSFLTAICPNGYGIGSNGVWAAPAGKGLEINQIFARYHRLWLTPLVECRSAAAVKPEELETRARDLHADGFILLFNQWPGDDWLATLRQAMKNSTLRLVVAAKNEDGSAVRLEPVARGGEFTLGGRTPTLARLVRRADLKGADGLAGTAPMLIAY